jgi:hypothetical protein
MTRWRGGPETATFDAVLGRSLAVGGLAVTSCVPKATAGKVYWHPYFALAVPGACAH